ncbi:SAM-dependent methyltransferase [Neptuniibacter halophilus]|uniref:SAM-dependent methyltransferase n=1 Tax=Neptuniibacter halophilus TaxID=651666 RepID=UPI0025723BFB|nr:cyclopropane-fatty-acyl-phospholipid synthase family protein [Neptuniibacter halophilus]
MSAYEQPSHPLQQQQPSGLEKPLLSLLKKQLERCQGQLLLTLPSGYQTRFGQQGPAASLQLNSLRPFVRLFFGGINGWSEGYPAGEWESQDLTALIRWALKNETRLEQMTKAGFIIRTLHNLYHYSRDNSRRGSRRNIAAHYDLGNEFYRRWLDAGMTYSAALFAHPGQPLEQAQANKNQRILQMLDARPGQQIVEIGCGWGAFARQAAEQNQLRVDGITLSREQLAWAQEKSTAAGLDSALQFSLTDYRDLQKSYDGVVSIEMFEAVGEAHWDHYFSTLKRILKPGGNAVLQVISIDDQRFLKYRKQADFIQRYIFPGGMLPSVCALKEKIAEHGFVLQQEQRFGKDYAETLRLWRQQFEDNWSEIQQSGFDQRFYRLWRYYLAYCEGGFEEGAIDVGLYQLRHA